MFEYKQSMTNAKSVLGVLGACVKCGEEIELICDCLLYTSRCV